MTKSNNDWQDALSSLLADLGTDSETEPVQAAVTPAPAKKTKAETLTMAFERKGRAGKCATIIYGFTSGDSEIEALAADMKKALGTGGSARGGEILIQGDRRDDVRRFLSVRGYKVKG